MISSLALMSVLNDINVQDGAAVRQLCSGLSSFSAREALEVLKHLDCARMDSTQFGLQEGEDKIGAANIANAHWVDESGKKWWGNYKGKWADFVQYVLDERRFWDSSGDRYLPTTSTVIGEPQARALLSSTYYFPFLLKHKDENLLAKHVLLPVLSRVKPKRLHMGSAAVYKMLAMAEEDVGNVLHLFEKSVDNLPDYKTFNDHANLWAMGTGSNYNDIPSGMQRANQVDWERANRGSVYLRLAGLANYLESWMNRCGSRGSAYKAVRKLASAKESEALLAKMSEGMARLFEITGSEQVPWDDYLAARGKLVGHIRGRKDFAVVATSGVALLRMGTTHFLLTREDLLSMKFSAMSHSMWHMYSASIKIEYEPISVEDKDESDDDEILVAAGRVRDEMAVFIRQAEEVAGAANLQYVVPYAVVCTGLDSIWAWYMATMAHAVESGTQDYFGRYLSEIFGVYTASLGGDLMTDTIARGIDEIIEEFGQMGYDVEYDVRTMRGIFAHLPASVIQDFGRLAKIVPAYDVDPVYSFLDRAKKMQEPNPIGFAQMLDEFGYEVNEMTEDQRDTANVFYRCGCRVMLSCADVRQRALDALPHDEALEARDDPYPAVMARLRRLQLDVGTSVRVLAEPAYPVPAAEDAEARDQAVQLVRHGEQPTNPLAGAYLDTGNIMSYEERGDPDLAILRATAIISSNITIAMSNISGLKRATPTRNNDGMRERGSGTMITDYLLDKFPSRSEALAFVSIATPVCSTSDKIETAKYPKKTRVITSMCAEGRRIQGEYEHNNGRVLVHVPGFMVGLNPADRLKRTYAALRQDAGPGKVRLYGSLDLSSFSTGMHWFLQHVTNDELFHAYGVSEEHQRKLEACTLGTYMIRVENNLRMFTVNSIGANYEGLDGKRNTFTHCTLWYMARCRAHRMGLAGQMRTFIYIDDGAFSIEVGADEVQEAANILRQSLVQVYTEYGLKVNLSKTVISTSYMQFLNEIFLHGVHIGYGFRALCHTAAQSFPVAATIAEELAVIVGGIRGSGVAGGQSMRLLVGFNYILWLYMAGVVGRKGRSIATKDAYVSTMILWLPTIAGGFGIPNWTSLFSNLSGNRDVEKLDRVAAMAKVVRVIYPDRYLAFKNYVKEHMIQSRVMAAGFVPDRVTVAHPGTASFGDKGRDMDIARAALRMAVNVDGKRLLSEFIVSGGKPAPNSLTGMLARALSTAPVRLPQALVSKALCTDPNAAVVTLVKKISSSYLVNRVLGQAAVRRYDRMYMRMGKRIMANGMMKLV